VVVTEADDVAVVAVVPKCVVVVVVVAEALEVAVVVVLDLPQDDKTNDTTRRQDSITQMAFLFT
jgi:hypothetical protein